MKGSRRRFSKKIVLLTAMLAALALGIGVAVAVWQVTGTGSGFAQAGTATDIGTVDLPPTGGVTGDQLFPGGVGDMRITINNPNPFPVMVTDITGAGPVTSNKGPACDAETGVTFEDQTGLSLRVPANSSATFTLDDVVRMSTESANECQGAVFTIPVALRGVSADADTGTTTDTTPTDTGTVTTP